ncbi:alanine racemase [Propionibacteriaceae bacterium Y1923]
MPGPVTATIDLSAISENLTALRTRVDAGTALLAPVKANAYGHGAVEVSRYLERTGHAQLLGVATVPEAQELRDAGISLPILKLSHCLPDELAAALAAGIALTVVDEDTVRAASAAVVAAGADPVAVHLKLDSGMGRIGAPLEEAEALAGLVAELPGLRLEGLFTHLPVSDLADDEGFTRQQLDAFAAVARRVRDRFDVAWVHAANSGGMLGHDLTGFTLARPGIAMYGYYPDATTPRSVSLRQALRWTSRLFFRKRVSAGTSIGYGRTWVAPVDTWVGTVPVGYADGFSRLNSNRGSMIINGRRVPVVGRVCMDQTMIDLGPDSVDRVGDEVVLLGGQVDQFIGTDELAELMGTITYEVTSLLAARVSRRYVE